MKTELRIFLTAMMFYTRIPCPGWVDHHPDYIHKSTRYFPLIGWIVGGVAAGVLAVGISVFSLHVAVVLSMAASVWVTGGFHEDGFADVCDGFGGGWTRERILEIMKDSRIGAYGVVGLLLLLLLKLFLTVEMVRVFPSGWNVIALLLVSAHALSRFSASTCIAALPYVRDDETGSKAKAVAASFNVPFLWIGGMLGLLPFLALMFLLHSPFLLFVLVPLAVTQGLMGRYFNKRIGGYTGDCLGAIQQVAEIMFIASAVGVWKFI